MKVLNILSSHYDQAFNNVLMDTFNTSLESNGHSQETIDLYKASFNPVMNGDDFNQFMNKEMPKEILDLQTKVSESDVLTFFYPVWWNDMPAIMKGWIDRVFSKGFAYDYGADGSKGMLGHIKKVILVCTLGNSQEEVVSSGLENAMRTKEEAGVFKYSGVQEVEHHFLYDVYKSEDIRNNYLDLMKTIAKNI